MKTRLVVSLAVAAVALSACSSSSSKTSNSSGAASANSTPKGTHTLVGTFVITAGSCSSASATPTGSYLEMLGSGGAPVKNSFGGCANADFTPLKPGTTGLVTGSYQPSPQDAIFGPTNFFGSEFYVNTASTDAQKGTSVPAPPLPLTLAS